MDESKWTNAPGINSTNRDDYGGDYAVVGRTPKIHPKLGVPLLGTRASIKGASRQYRTFFRGDIIFAENPEKEFNFTLCPDPSASSEGMREHWMLLKIEKGFRPCEAKDWDLRPELREIYSVENGQIVLIESNDPLRPAKSVVMYRTKERMLEEEAALQQIDKIVPQQSQANIAGAIDDKRVSVLPPQISVETHSYKPDEVTLK